MSNRDTSISKSQAKSINKIKSESTDNERQPCLDRVYDSIPSLRNLFKIIRKVGEGTFSKVYLAELLEVPNNFFALKHLVPTSSPKRVENELRCLHELRGQNNIIDVKACIRHEDNIALVMPYIPHEKFQDYVYKMSATDTRNYMRNLFIALKHVHSHSIIHRDIKPSNFLLSSDTGKYFLLDFGLAQNAPQMPTDVVHNENKCPQKATDCTSLHGADQICNLCIAKREQKAPREGTPGFRPPEVLLRYPHQTTAIDIWSAGVVLLSILSAHYPFFKAEDDMTALAQIMSITGSKEMAATAKSLGKRISNNPEIPPLDLKTVCTKLRRNRSNVLTSSSTSNVNSDEFSTYNPTTTNEIMFPDSAYDLAKRCIDLDPASRITAAEALKHPFLSTDSHSE
ncbi:putative cell division control protein 7-like protein 2 [Trichoplax sp. H2]|uniref:non-specific serine/threonine protein kinase n=1 Tax=Trichoplax adhaerens TaxID=10228 RepID=B3RP02_TRIAD|nr:hypothetical protein TRIADDRAFT_53354 [Trichoplax adhaerens]EDV27547.1 hypothetical protein TRIADDRAFT_53354 [Trichoplax adhaerens]RDD43421.1 putative cell division control protein 7-like protein 2 [Trichoplax sp. H2]|eukprot:XP_002109381.1 hypothetical protein TRIADDRAFT_53354 [Trichoplax adhaerens]